MKRVGDRSHQVVYAVGEDIVVCTTGRHNTLTLSPSPFTISTLMVPPLFQEIKAAAAKVCWKRLLSTSVESSDEPWAGLGGWVVKPRLSVDAGLLYLVVKTPKGLLVG